MTIEDDQLTERAPQIDDDPPPLPDPPAEGKDAPAPPPRAPRGRLKPLEDTRGVYAVLAAERPARGEPARWIEVEWQPAGDPKSAKKKALDGDFGAWLKAIAATRRGLLLRAVPAMHWPAEVEPTTYVRPDPILTIG